MNTRRCLKIADRINALLLRELRQGIDRQRMVAEPLYARDVLLVCDAFPGSDLASLAEHFRAAATEAEPAHEPEAGPSTGWGASRFLSSFFGPSSPTEAARGKPSGWSGRRGPGK